jgi:hypothetical protein
MGKNILFFDPHLNERGASVAIYDYANYNETILGNKSIIVSLKDSSLKSFDKFKNRFEVILLDNVKDIQQIQCDYFYNLKYGHNDHVLHPEAKNLIHVVFPAFEPHGDVYAYISEWLTKEVTDGKFPYVPHIVNLPNIQDDYKDFLNIKTEELTVGWFGGYNTFDDELNIAKQVVIDVAKKRKNIKFVFMNQESFCNEENIIFIKGTTDLEQKTAFINTCDVMLHARGRGETFGLAIAEFSLKNKPVITYSGSKEKNHIMMLGDKGLYYHDYNSLYNILINIQTSDIEGKNWNCYQEFTPEKVMNKFNKVFLS